MPLDLNRKLGPLPAWGWAAAAGGTVLGVVGLRRLRAKNSPAGSAGSFGTTGPASSSGDSTSGYSPSPSSWPAPTQSDGQVTEPGGAAYLPININVTSTPPNTTASPQPVPTGVAHLPISKGPALHKTPSRVPPVRHPATKPIVYGHPVLKGAQPPGRQLSQHQLHLLHLQHIQAVKRGAKR